MSIYLQSVLIGSAIPKSTCALFQIYADLALLPSSSVCGDADGHMINMLRHAMLQVSITSTNEFIRFMEYT